jgi:hypothetical protein
VGLREQHAYLFVRGCRPGPRQQGARGLAVVGGARQLAPAQRQPREHQVRACQASGEPAVVGLGCVRLLQQRQRPGGLLGGVRRDRIGGGRELRLPQVAEAQRGAPVVVRRIMPRQPAGQGAPTFYAAAGGLGVAAPRLHVGQQQQRIQCAFVPPGVLRLGCAVALHHRQLLAEQRFGLRQLALLHGQRAQPRSHVRRFPAQRQVVGTGA